MLLFLPSFFGAFLFRYLEYGQKGERFGRGRSLNEPLWVPASNYRTKEIKEHTVDVLKIGPTIHDRVFGLAFLALPALWYGLLIAFWFFVPSTYDLGENTSLLEICLPFLLPLPFVIVGIVLLAVPRTFRFDRSQRRLQITNWWTRRVLPLDEISSLQLIPGQGIQRGTDDDNRRRRRVTSYSTMQLNLVLENPKYPRLNIFHDADTQAAAETALVLSRFVGVPLDDVTDPAPT